MADFPGTRIRQLAINWQQQARDALQERDRYPEIRSELAIAAQTQKNCAEQLMKGLNEMEKENPTEAGSLPPLNAERESAQGLSRC